MAKKDYRNNEDAEIRVQGRVSGSLREKVKADLVTGYTMQEIIIEALKLKYPKDEGSKHNY
jgi:hypothetical protein